MPPRRMGSIRVVVVFSSRFSFFSGGPEPPSPAARLLLRPDIAAVAAGSSGLSGADRRAEAALPSPAENRAQSYGGTWSPGAPSVPLNTPAGPRPRWPSVRTHGRVSRAPPSWTSPDVTGRQTHSAGVRAAPDVAKLISCFYWRLLVPPLESFRFFSRWIVYLSVIGQ